jgi:hypothetical protein
LSKKRRPTPRKPQASAARRTSARPAASRPQSKSTTKPKGGVVELKPIQAEILRAVAGLKTMPPTEAIKITIERLERCLAEFDAICDPNQNGLCGPDMAFPSS